MNLKRGILLTFLLFALPVVPKMGCYKNDRFGSKRFVQCFCQCTTTHPICIWCHHSHEAQHRLEIIQTTTPTKTTQKAPLPLFPTVDTIFKRYKTHYAAFFVPKE